MGVINYHFSVGEDELIRLVPLGPIIPHYHEISEGTEWSFSIISPLR